MNRTVTVAAVQFQLHEVGSFADFAATVRSVLDQTGDAEIVVLPELVTTPLFTVRPDWRTRPVTELADVARYTDEYLALFRSLASSRGQTILGGTHLTRSEDRVYNTAYLFRPDGSVITHAKTHLLNVEREWGTVEGDRVTTVDLGGVRVGISICYETEVPEVATILARQGARVLLVPSYTFGEAGFWRVRHCASARCVENQVYAVHSPTVGSLGGPLSAGVGRAGILGPCDTGFPSHGVIAAATTDACAVVRATLDLDLLDECRATGAATTVRDRLRRAPLYQAYADELRQVPATRDPLG